MRRRRLRSPFPPALASALGAAAVAGAVLATAPVAAQVSSVDEIRVPPLPRFDIPQPRRATLPNGMVVMLVEDHELPLVEGVALIHTGSRLEPAAKAGLAALTGQVLRSGGTAARSGDELDDLLEGKAASIETGISTELGQASFSCLKADFPEILQLFAEVLRRPAFAADKLAVAKTGAVAAIARQNDNPQQILFRELTKLVYGPDSPYARNPTYASIDAISRDDLIAWHRRGFHPERVELGLVGDFDADRALALVRGAFGDWPRGPALPEPAPVFREAARPGLYFVEKNDMTQANIALGELGIEKNDPDFYPVEVLNDVLSGSFSSRLVAEIRTARGLAYAVGGGVGSSFDHPGMTAVWMTTKTETAGEGLGALLDEIEGLTRRPPTDEEVDRAKTAILNSFIFNFDSADKILLQQLYYQHFGYPLDRMERYRQGIERVRVAEVKRAAAEKIHPDRFAILVVGPAAARAQLAAFGEVRDLDITIPEPPAPAAEPATPAAAKRGAALLDLAISAMGGAERIDRLRALETVAAVVQQGPQGEVTIPVTTTYAYPDRFRQEARLPLGTMALVVTGSDGFMLTPQGVADLGDSQRADLAREMRRDLLWIVKARGREDFAAVAVGGGEVGGTPVERVRVTIGDEATILAVDPETGRVLQLAYRGTGPAGAPGDATATFSDFRDVGGLVYPYSVAQSFNGEPVASAQVERVTLDPPLEAGRFAPQ